MVMGVPLPPEGAAQRFDRTEALSAAHQPNADALRTAEQMRQAGLKYRPAMMTPVVWVAIAIGVGLFVFAWLAG